MKRYILALSLVVVLTPQCFGWLSGYTYKKNITVPDANCDDNLTDFPFTFVITDDSDIGGHMENTTDFNDIRFTTTGDANFPVEKVYFDITAGVCNAVLKGKVNLSSAGTTFYCYYGKTDDHSDWGTGDEIYDSNFVAVYHMDDDPNDSVIQDSTSNDNDGDKKGAAEPNEVSALITNGQDFDGSDDYIKVNDSSSLKWGAGDFTVSAWIKTSHDYSSAAGYIVMKGTTSDYWWILCITGNNKAQILIDDDTALKAVNGITTINDDGWHHLAGIRDGDYLKIYTDIADSNSIDITGYGDIDSTEDLYIGCRWSGSIDDRFIYDLVDEIRISDKARSAAWIKMEYYNQLSTYGYEQNWGSEQTEGAGGTSAAYYRHRQ